MSEKEGAYITSEMEEFTKYCKGRIMESQVVMVKQQQLQ